MIAVKIMNIPELNDLSRRVIGAAIDVHRELGPGHDEILYEDALAVALAGRSLPFQRQQSLPILYRGCRLESGFRTDFVVGNELVVEVKSAESMHPVFGAQVRTYQRLGGWRLGLLFNFNVPLLTEGIERFIIDPVDFRPHELTSKPSRLPVGDFSLPLDAAGSVIQFALNIHRILGPGLLNSVYSDCLRHDLLSHGVEFVQRQPLAVQFGGQTLRHSAQLELGVSGRVAVLVLTVPRLLKLHEARLRSQMRLASLPEGVLINFHSDRLADGLRRLSSVPSPSLC